MLTIFEFVPFAFRQAIDRVHRIGQTRPVTVHRFSVEDSIEDAIILLQDTKKGLASSVLGEGAEPGAKAGAAAALGAALSSQDLKKLFQRAIELHPKAQK